MWTVCPSDRALCTPLLTPRASKGASIGPFTKLSECLLRAGPCWELGPQGQMWALPSGDLILEVVREKRSQPCGQLISVLISQTPQKGWAQDGPPGSLRLGWGWSLGSRPSQSLPPATSPSPRAALSACKQVSWSLLNLQEACGTSQNPVP